MGGALAVLDDEKKQRPRERPPAFRIPMTVKKAKKNVAYQMLRDAAVERLTGENAKGSFSKDELLEATSLVGLEVNWLILRDLLKEETGLDFYPVSSLYFKTRREGDDPSRYLCQGHGKKTAGYIVAQESNGPAIKRILKVRENQLKGGVSEFARKVTEASAHVGEITSGEAPLSIPSIKDDDETAPD